MPIIKRRMTTTTDAITAEFDPPGFVLFVPTSSK